MMEYTSNKALIITLFDMGNYGNRLQNYAIYTYLKKCGIDSVTLPISKNYGKTYSIKKYLLDFICQYTKLWKIKKFRRSYRRFVFEKFTKKYIPVYNIDMLSIETASDMFQFVILGSDQIWNPNWDIFKQNIKIFFADFVEEHKRIAFSASFGVEKITEKDIDNYYKDYIKKIKYISIREESGARIVKQLTGRDVPVLIDPTMLLDAKEWLEISTTPKKQIKGNYILKYFLGGQTNEQRIEIERIARQNNLVEVEMLNMDIPDLYVVDPSEFIYLISNATLVCTDSFHACVFSILFNKPFLVYTRNGKGADMGSRISTLLNKFGLMDRMPGKVSKERIFDHDYNNCYKLLHKERLRVADFLKTAGIYCEETI